MTRGTEPAWGLLSWIIGQAKETGTVVPLCCLFSCLLCMCCNCQLSYSLTQDYSSGQAGGSSSITSSDFPSLPAFPSAGEGDRHKATRVQPFPHYPVLHKVGVGCVFISGCSFFASVEGAPKSLHSTKPPSFQA